MQDLSQYTKRTHVEIQTKYFSFIVVVSITLVGLVFALGVLVGSRQSFSRVCPEGDALAVLDSRSSEPTPRQIADQTKLSFHNSLVETPSHVPTPASLLSKPDGTDNIEKAPLTPPPDVTATRPQMAEPPIPETVPHDEPGIYSLQVGSFQTKREANEMVRKLQKAGYGAFLVSVNMPDRGGMWYRVRVGPFRSKREVWDKKRDFEAKERLPAFVVKRRAKG